MKANRTTTAKKCRRPVCAITAIGLILITADLVAAKLDYGFDAYDSLDEARIEAVKTKRNLFVLSGAPWCRWCEKTKTFLGSLDEGYFKDKFVRGSA